MTIRCICFDIGGVANYFHENSLCSLIQEKWGTEVNLEQFRDIAKPIINGKDYRRKFQKGKITAAEFLNISCAVSHLEVTSDNLQKMEECLVSWAGQPYYPTINLADRLKRNGYHTSVLSNNNEIMYVPPAAELIRHVDVAISSHEIGYVKPHLKAYKILLKRIGALGHPEEVVFIDDKIANVIAANEVGINGFWFRSSEIPQNHAFEELLSYLKEKDVNVE